MASVNTTDEKYTTTNNSVTLTEQIKMHKSNEDLYQGRTSSTADSQENAATLDADNQVEATGKESNFKSKRELFEFTLVMTGIIFAMFMMSLNSTVVAPAMSIIATELNAIEQQTWIATAYLVAVNSFQPLAGKVSLVLLRKFTHLTNSIYEKVLRHFRKVLQCISLMFFSYSVLTCNASNLQKSCVHVWHHLFLSRFLDQCPFQGHSNADCWSYYSRLWRRWCHVNDIYPCH